MKKFLAVFAVCLSLAAVSLDADAARRFGGGSSFGRSAPTFTQKAPAPAAVPRTPAKQQPAAGQQQRQQQGAAAAGAQQAKPSMARSVLTGLAAALGITALLSMLGINGAGMVSFVMGAILLLIAFMVIRALFFRRRGSVSGRGAGEQTMSAPEMSRAEPAPRPEPARFDTSAVPGSRTGSVMDEFVRGSAQASDEAAGAVDVTPADFDRAGFLATAKENYIKLQHAWDTGNVIEISDFTTQDVFVAITHQLRERGAQQLSTEVVSLDDELLGIAQEEKNYVAAVRFTGTLRISGEEESVDETWILEKPVEGEGGWLLAGIKQNA
jgi:predicted lipid-binding transport protein (Tim44 family)